MRAFTILLTSLTLLAAGCGGDDESAAPEGQADDTGAAATTATDDATGTGGAAAGDKVVVKMTGIAYEPKQATVAVGQTVEWVNEDPVQHDVESKDGSTIDSELFSKGETFTYTPEEPGTIAYVCTIHPGMEGTLTVTE